MTAHAFPAELDARVSAAASGDKSAYERLVHDHRRLVATISLAIVGEVAASEDVAQEVFVAAWLGLPRLRNPSSFLPWLRQMTRNRAHKFLESRRRRREAPARPRTLEAREGETTTDALIAAAVDPRPHAEAGWILAEEEAVLSDALAALPDESREILTLFYREGQSVRQVADLLGLSEVTAKKRLSRARSKLREDVERRFGEAAERTSPSVSFTNAVIAALPAGSTGAGSALAWKLTAWLGKGFATFSGLLLGILGGLAGVFIGFKQVSRGARDPEERRQLVRFGATQAALVVAVECSYPFLSGWPALLVGLLFLIGLNATVWLWLPRIVARRRAAELADDPVRAKAKHRREWIVCLVGTTVGTGTALAAFVRNFLHG